MDRLLTRDTLLVVGVNALPLLGVFFAGWDVFTILVLYWLETAIVGFWVCMRVLNAPADALAAVRQASGRPVGRFELAAFIVAQASIFMGVHFLFLWTLFGGDWPDRVHGPMAFVTLLVAGTGLWLPLLAIFLLRGMEALAAIRADAPLQPAITSFYVRIFIMQVVILGGAWLSIVVGSVGGLVVLVAAKTAIDLAMTPLLSRIEGAIKDAVAAGRDNR